MQEDGEWVRGTVKGDGDGDRDQDQDQEDMSKVGAIIAVKFQIQCAGHRQQLIKSQTNPRGAQMPQICSISHMCK